MALNDRQDISLKISDILKEKNHSIILLDMIEYLITSYGFERVSAFLQEKKFDILEANAILLISMELISLNDQHKAPLTSE